MVAPTALPLIFKAYSLIFHSTIGWERMRSRMSVSENSFSGE